MNGPMAPAAVLVIVAATAAMTAMLTRTVEHPEWVAAFYALIACTGAISATAMATSSRHPTDMIVCGFGVVLGALLGTVIAVTL